MRKSLQRVVEHLLKKSIKIVFLSVTMDIYLHRQILNWNLNIAIDSLKYTGLDKQNI